MVEIIVTIMIILEMRTNMECYAITTRLNVPPCSKPRMTQRDRWKKRQCVLDFFAFRDAVRQEKEDWSLIGKDFEYESFEIEFHIQMPKSWSLKKKDRCDGKPHQQRPDLDNLLKGWKDSVYEEDAVVWHVEATKLWTFGPGYIMVTKI